MGKNLKDIVDEGFSQLAVLAEKRAEILSRAEKISEAAGGSKASDAEQKLRNSESEYVAEMNARSGQLLQELKTTLAEVTDDNITFQGGVRSNFKQQVSGIINELERSKTYHINGTA